MKTCELNREVICPPQPRHTMVTHATEPSAKNRGKKILRKKGITGPQKF